MMIYAFKKRRKEAAWVLEKMEERKELKKTTFQAEAEIARVEEKKRLAEAKGQLNFFPSETFR